MKPIVDGVCYQDTIYFFAKSVLGNVAGQGCRN